MIRGLKLGWDGWFLTERCNFIAISGCCHDMLSVVCHLCRECIVTRWLKLGSCGFHIKVAKDLNFSIVSVTRNSKGSPWSGAQTSVGWFSTSRPFISETVRDRARWQLITNGNKSCWPLMTLNVKSLLCRQCYACCAETAEARICLLYTSPSPRD